MKWLWLFGLLLASGLQLMAQNGSDKHDYYYVLHSGDTVRTGIESMSMRFKRGWQYAFVRYENGKKQTLSVETIRAFSFTIEGSWFFKKQIPDQYHQVEIIELSQKSTRQVPLFFETIATCNGYSIYRDFHVDSQYWRYLLAKGKVVLDVIPSNNRERTRLRLIEIMPECIQAIDMQIWPYWARKHYKKVAPKKPVH